MKRYYMDVNGLVKEMEEWMNEFIRGRINLLDLKDLKEVNWDSELQRWMMLCL